MKKAFLMLALGLICVSVSAAADKVPSRSQKQLGAIISSNGEPFPGGMGYNLAFNPTWYSRVSIGYSDRDFEQVYGGSVRFFPLKSRFGPMYALGVSEYSGSNDRWYNWEGLKNHKLFFYSLLGFDLQSYSGFHVSFGVSRGHWRDAGNGIFVDLGWFFGLKKSSSAVQPSVTPVETPVATAEPQAEK